MTTFSYQLYELITSDGGRLAYQLVILFSILGALLAAISHWRVSSRTQTRRLLVGLSLLLVLNLAGLVTALLMGQGLILGADLLPVIERGIGLLSTLVIVWLWAYPGMKTAPSTWAWPMWTPTPWRKF